ncbi:MAG: hypothetical protein FJY21_07130 [Bacteroidetes bacterium]|nr:hypothetical protein [Bacteroidota bacterium]
MGEKIFSRRKFINKYLVVGVVKLGLGTMITGSSLKSMANNEKIRQQEKKPQENQKNPCDDLTGVSAEEVAKRKKLAYVNKTPIPDNHCSNCALYLPAAKDKPCGGCMLFKGPVRAEGYCAYWAPINN